MDLIQIWRTLYGDTDFFIRQLSYSGPFHTETYCSGDVLFRRRFVEETFCVETFCMCASLARAVMAPES
jgi:hypothetical protein